MVKETAVLILLGQNIPQKESFLKELKEKLFPPSLLNFNFDILYARELKLKELQEKLLLLPLKVKRRLVLLRESEYLKEEIREFILKYIQSPYAHVLFILDFYQTKLGNYKKDNALKSFLIQLKNAKIKFLEFGEVIPPDVFKLAEAIDNKDYSASLRILNWLLQRDNEPELILGGLRGYWQKKFYLKGYSYRMRSLLICDLEIKQNILPPQFALEKLVLTLCNFRKL